MDDRLLTIADAGAPVGGATPLAVRNHNERLVLSLLRNNGPMGSADIARATNLSAQTASVITRSMESEGFLKRGDPVKGKVGKPTTPLEIDPEGVVSYGLRIGRRSADFTQTDLAGGVRGHLEQTYAYPTPSIIAEFVLSGLRNLPPPRETSRIAGLGIGSPFELWNWLELLDADADEMRRWRDFNLETDLSDITDLPVRLGNDMNMAAFGELHFGDNRALSDFSYFYIGSLGGGGIVMGRRLLEGPSRNAGAFGSMPVYTRQGGATQLNAQASIFPLEREIQNAGRDSTILWRDETGWRVESDLVTRWLDSMAEALATAAVSVTAVLDLPNVVIDGSFPSFIRADLVERVENALARQDLRGISAPCLYQGSLGRLAGAYGAAHRPLAQSFLMD